MATKAKIVYLNKVAPSIEIASEGYPEYCASLLQKHFNTDKKLKALLNIGNIDRLESTLESLKPLDEQAKTECFVGAMGQLAEGTWADYIYVFKAQDKQDKTHTSITAAVLIKLIGKSAPTARKYLSHFVSLGLIEAQGSNKNRTYTLTKLLYLCQ